MSLGAANEAAGGAGASDKHRVKGLHIGAPACFALELACADLERAFCRGDGAGGVYVVGSVLERPDWRDVDVRLILSDEAFAALFPEAGLKAATWESDPRWLVMTVAISERLAKITGLPVDFQFQAQSYANARHHGPRSSVGVQRVQ